MTSWLLELRVGHWQGNPLTVLCNLEEETTLSFSLRLEGSELLCSPQGPIMALWECDNSHNEVFLREHVHSFFLKTCVSFNRL